MSLPLPSGTTLEARLTARLARVRDARGRSLMLKRLSPRLRGEALAERMFAVEVHILRRLPRGLGPAYVAHGEDSAGPWLLEEYLLGHDLGAWITRYGAMPEPLVAQLFERGKACLRRLHEASDRRGALELIHGDVAPGNLLLSPALDLHLIDFDLGSVRGAPRPVDGRVRGTLHYISPRIARGEALAPADDTFALAMCMLFALTGAPPRTESGAALVLAAGEGPPTLPPIQDPALARALASALDLHPG